MSFGFIIPRILLEPDVEELSIAIPSITIRGSLLADKEEPPRILMAEPAPGAPPGEIILTPAAFPLNAS